MCLGHKKDDISPGVKKGNKIGAFNPQLVNVLDIRLRLNGAYTFFSPPALSVGV